MDSDQSLLDELVAAVERQRWGLTEELLATLCEQIDALIRLLHRVHSKPGSQSLKPLRIDRPHRKTPRVSPADLARHMLGR